MTRIKLISIGLFASLCSFTACTSSNLNITEYSSSADPSQEISRVEENIKNAKMRQADVLSPNNFASAVASLDRAKEAQQQNSDQSAVLHKIAVAQAYLDNANKTTDLAYQSLPGIVRKRQEALDADVSKYFPKEFEAADEQLKIVTVKFEKGNTLKAEKSQAFLEEQYSNLELNSIKQANLGIAKENVKIAINEGAKSLTPQTLVWAEKEIKSNELIINEDRHNKAAVEKASASALAASNKLLTIVREANSAKKKNPEQIAEQAVNAQEQVAQADEQLNKVAGTLANSEQSLAQIASENNKLKYQAWLEEKYEHARQEFSPDEAEVYKQGDKLLLRLKGLSFKTAQASIPPKNYPVLEKVQGVIKDFGEAKVVVEGHTDATGSKEVNKKLSAKRAEAVASYLVTNKNVSPDHIESHGYGDDKPVANNKTQKGRAENRRVDIIISPTNTW